MYVFQYNVYRGQNIFCASCCSTFDFRARIEKISPCVLFFRALLPNSPHQEHKAHPLLLFFPPLYIFHSSSSSSRMICSLTIDEMLLLGEFCADYWRCGLDGASGAPLPLLLLLLLRTAAHRSTRISAKISPRFVQGFV